jgi:hypothetical protein
LDSALENIVGRIFYHCDSGIDTIFYVEHCSSTSTLNTTLENAVNRIVYFCGNVLDRIIEFDTSLCIFSSASTLKTTFVKVKVVLDVFDQSSLFYSSGRYWNSAIVKYFASLFYSSAGYLNSATDKVLNIIFYLCDSVVESSARYLNIATDKVLSIIFYLYDSVVESSVSDLNSAIVKCTRFRLCFTNIDRSRLSTFQLEIMSDLET